MSINHLIYANLIGINNMKLILGTPKDILITDGYSLSQEIDHSIIFSIQLNQASLSVSSDCIEIFLGQNSLGNDIYYACDKSISESSLFNFFKATDD